MAAVQKWTGGLKEQQSLDCPIAPLWDLASDWAHWDRFYPDLLETRLIEGENRKVGCLRYAKVGPETWTNERLLAIDNHNYSLAYNMEDNMFNGHLKGYRAQAQFEPAADGTCKLRYWSWELEPMETMSYDDFANFINDFLSTKLLSGLVAAAKKLASGETGAPTVAPVATAVSGDPNAVIEA